MFVISAINVSLIVSFLNVCKANCNMDNKFSVMLYLILGVEKILKKVVGHITEGACRPQKVKYFVFI